MLEAMWEFCCSVEKDLACIADIIPPYIEARRKILDIPCDAAITLAKNLEHRFATTCPLQLPMFAYLMTAEGLAYYRTHPDLQAGLKQSAEAGMLGYMKDRHLSRGVAQMNSEGFNKYLTDFPLQEFDKASAPVVMWRSIYQSFHCDYFPISLALLASEVLTIPSSEAAVERVFSALSRATSTEMCNVTPLTLNARLVVKFDSIFGSAGKVEWQELVEDPVKTLKLYRYPALGYSK